jgi:threonine/homoserine/homoserine lactone efflux protein
LQSTGWFRLANEYFCRIITPVFISEESLYYLTQGIIFGIYAAFLPGPLQAFLLSRILQNGWKQTLPLAFIPLFSDGPVMLTLYLVLSQLPVWLPTGLRIIGGFFIIYLAWDAFRSRDKQKANQPAPTSRTIDKAGFIKGVTMNLLNPNVYIFWATIGVPTILEGWNTAPILGIAYFAGIYGAMIPGIMLWITMIGTIGFLKPAVQRIIAIFIALLLMIVGIVMIINGIQSLLPLFI